MLMCETEDAANGMSEQLGSAVPAQSRSSMNASTEVRQGERLALEQP
jgi:hypothetical protein